MRTIILFVFALIAAAVARDCIAENRNSRSEGKPIYSRMCAKCHGDHGQGDPEQDADPLVGDLSIQELAKIISETMPEEDPEQCVGDDARNVASYIHDSFYSHAAQSRRNPPRTRLARLTAEQLRQSVADLYAHFGKQGWTTGERGIEGTYFTGVGRGDDRVRIQRTDMGIDFDFGHDGPGHEIDPQVFYIRWNGALLAPRSGSYEIIIRSSCSFKMQFGRLGPLFFDNHVQSAGKEEFRQTVNLTGGRIYPIKIDLQQRKRKTEQPAVRISLSWQPPDGAQEIIPARNLLPAQYPSSFALQSKLPPDDSSYGYERGIAIDRSWDQSTTDAAIEFSDVVIDDLFPAYVKNIGGDKERRTKLREFLVELIGTAFRGPLSDELIDQYVDQVLAANGDDDSLAIRHAVLKCFKSPRFLYPTIDTDRPDSQRTANRLALILFDSLPSDAWLIDQIKQNNLHKDEEIEQAAWRMVEDYRARSKLRSFLYHWLDLADLGQFVKDDELYPDFDPQLIGDLSKSLDTFMDAVVQSDASDFRELLTADWAPTNEHIAQFYGGAWERSYARQSVDDSHETNPIHPPSGEGSYDDQSPVPEGLSRSTSDPQIHVGVLTHPLLMSHFAYYKSSSPIHRGVFLTRYVLGRVIRPPDESFTPFDEKLHPELTTRQRVQLQTSEKNCQVCHQKINSLGFALENFDAAGRYRSTEGDRPIDAGGSYQPRQGELAEFNDARELGDFLASSDDCQRAFVESAFEYFVKQPIAAYGRNASDRLLKSFRDDDFHIRKLMVQIAILAADRRHFESELDPQKRNRNDQTNDTTSIRP